MLNLAAERAHLAKANSDIADGEKRITAQAQLIERLHANGYNTDQADLLLLNLQQTLAVWKAHREQILQAIMRLDQMPPH